MEVPRAWKQRHSLGSEIGAGWKGRAGWGSEGGVPLLMGERGVFERCQERR